MGYSSQFFIESHGYLALAKYGGSGHRGFIIIPEGKGGQGLIQLTPRIFPRPGSMMGLGGSFHGKIQGEGLMVDKVGKSLMKRQLFWWCSVNIHNFICRSPQ